MKRIIILLVLLLVLLRSVVYAEGLIDEIKIPASVSIQSEATVTVWIERL